MICRNFKRNGIKLLDNVKFDDEICSVAGFDLEDDFVLITYSFGWRKTFTYRNSEIKSEKIIVHPSFLGKNNNYYWVNDRYLKVIKDYNNIIEI